MPKNCLNKFQILALKNGKLLYSAAKKYNFCYLFIIQEKSNVL